MRDSGQEDSITHLNTQLNKSMVLMEDATDVPPEHPRRSKSIKINTKIQPPTASNSPVVKSRRSILKKPDRSFSEKSTDNEIRRSDGDIENLSNSSQRLLSSALGPARPRNLQELIQKEILDVESVSPESFDLDEVSDSEEIWIMDIPKSIDPKELHGQKIILGDKSKIKIQEKRYCAVARNISYNVTCILNTGKEKPLYKTVNIKPVGLLTVRRKLSGMLKVEPIPLENSSMPVLPDDLRIRHPLLGVNYDGKVRKKSKKRNSIKKEIKS
ncbi:PREDICTED: uncharacterized protein LOC106748038 isoform X2 [Dinoponera quadriceps]|nr:PREDICTED: uncharacterized protein LOC106748038 isoform X2 [Dinoponera quadriceps]XP_014481707.1 PREDICTED: uncharacterized protein LOC106748038 isoform X2 [Dinoponera quadriceps]